MAKDSYPLPTFALLQVPRLSNLQIIPRSTPMKKFGLLLPITFVALLNFEWVKRHAG